MAHETLLNPSGQLAKFSLCIVQLRPKELQQAAIDIIMECKHETKVADVVILFVLTLGNSATL